MKHQLKKIIRFAREKRPFREKFNDFYGWYMTFYSNGKSTPILTSIVDAISLGSFFTPFVANVRLSEVFWLNILLNLILGSTITVVSIIITSMIVAFVGYRKIRYGTTAKEIEINTRQNPILMKIYNDIEEIRMQIAEMRKVESHVKRT